MDSRPHPLIFLLLLVSGWVNRQQTAVIDYLLEENRILRAAHAVLRKYYIRPVSGHSAGVPLVRSVDLADAEA